MKCLTHLYDWCIALLINMKQQLTSIRKLKTKHFGYGTILMKFFFEKIPGLRPKVISSISSPRDPRIAQWADLMKRLGGSEVPRTTWDDEFFLWWGDKSSLWKTIPMPEWIFVAIQTLYFHQVRHGAQSVSLQFFDLYNFWIFSIYVKKCGK